MRWLDGITDSIDMNLSQLWEIVRDREALHAAARGVTKSRTLSGWTTNSLLKNLKCSGMTVTRQMHHLRMLYKPPQPQGVKQSQLSLPYIWHDYRFDLGRKAIPESPWGWRGRSCAFLIEATRGEARAGNQQVGWMKQKARKILRSKWHHFWRKMNHCSHHI